MKEIFEMIRASPELKIDLGIGVFITLVYFVFETFAVLSDRKKARKIRLDYYWGKLTDEVTNENIIELFEAIKYIVCKDKLSLMTYTSLEYPNGCPGLDELRMIALGALERQIERVSRAPVIMQNDGTVNGEDGKEIPRVLHKHQFQGLKDQRTILRAMVL
ncbi:MAG TPA: hypothetical protein VL335_00160 [Candidatus Paceibacterota bacterium]|jgi:hypothetical protein|nr:hypothetical protein [Candidatus Paceibacterota bacterium]